VRYTFGSSDSTHTQDEANRDADERAAYRDPRVKHEWGFLPQPVEADRYISTRAVAFWGKPESGR